MKNVHNGLVPINKLPTEVLCHIFGSVIYDDTTIQEIRQALLVLTSVCQNWRHTVVSNGVFWSNIVMKPSPPSIECADAFLTRSSGALLNVVVDNRSGEWSGSPLLERCLEDLSTNGHRIRKYSIFFGGSLTLLQQVTKFNVPRLGILRLDASGALYNDHGQARLPRIFHGSLPGL